MNLARLYRTVRHLRFQQILARVRLRFRRVTVGRVTNPSRRSTGGIWTRSPRKNVGVVGPAEFSILNKTIRVDGDKGWNDPGQDKLLLYHLHYHDVLNTAAVSPREFDGSSFIKTWIDDNPPAYGNGWEPYPLSLRIVNWLKWHLEDNELDDVSIRSLYLQARVLFQTIEYHLLANHLFENAKALYFAGLFFNTDESDSWYRTAVAILVKEFPEQILPDGGHFELSPMYQATLVEGVLDIINIASVYDDHSFDDAPNYARRMISWLTTMSHGDGLPSYFNDATIGIAAPLPDILRYSERLGVEASLGIRTGLQTLTDSGYVRYQSGSMAIIADIGHVGPDYQPGHGHCDCLSFELSAGRDRLLVNSGVTTYNVNARRLRERQTASHNTVSVRCQEQTEVWSGFRVGRRARPVDVDVGHNSVRAGHDGYARLGIMHHREFLFDSNRVDITDMLTGDASATGVAHFHFHPNEVPIVSADSVKAGRLAIAFSGSTRVEESDYEYSDGFNKPVVAKKLCVTFVSSLVTTVRYEDTVSD